MRSQRMSDDLALGREIVQIPKFEWKPGMVLIGGKIAHGCHTGILGKRVKCSRLDGKVGDFDDVFIADAVSRFISSSKHRLFN